MRYSSVIYSCYIIGVVAGLAGTGDQINNFLLQNRNEPNYSSFLIFPRSPTDRPPSRGRGQSQNGTPPQRGNSPQSSGSKNEIKAFNGIPRTPSQGTPHPQSRPQSRGTPRSQDTPQPVDTPQSHSSETISGGIGRGQTPGRQSSPPGGQNQATSSRSGRYGGRGRGWRRGQDYYDSRYRDDLRALQVHTPTNYASGYDPHSGNHYGPYVHAGYPVHQPVPGYQRQFAVATSPMHGSPGGFMPPTRVETFAHGPGKYHAHGGNEPWSDVYLRSGERGSKSAGHDRISYGGGETMQHGRIVTRVSGRKVQSKVEPGLGGGAQIKYRTPEGVAVSSFTYPAKGQVGFTSSTGEPVTLQTEISGPASIHSTASNSPPRRDQG